MRERWRSDEAPDSDRVKKGLGRGGWGGGKKGIRKRGYHSRDYGHKSNARLGVREPEENIVNRDGGAGERQLTVILELPRAKRSSRTRGVNVQEKIKAKSDLTVSHRGRQGGAGEPRRGAGISGYKASAATRGSRKGRGKDPRVHWASRLGGRDDYRLEKRESIRIRVGGSPVPGVKKIHQAGHLGLRGGGEK